MKTRKFTATVKEREAGQPCFVMIEGLKFGGAELVLDLREGTGLREAQAIAARLNEHVIDVSPLVLE